MAEKNSSNDVRKKEKSEESVEQNLSSGYIPKSKLGNMPMTNQIDLDVTK
jgi:hypothetical protein